MDNNKKPDINKMKSTRVLMAALLLSAAALPVSAQSCVDMFKKGNSLRANKKWSEAIVYYQRAMACDPNLRSDCNKWIKYCTRQIADESKADKERLTLSAHTVIIPYQGGDQEIGVFSGKKWTVEGNSDWCKTEADNGKMLLVQCRDANNGTRDKVTNLTVKSGIMMQQLKVVQQGRPEYLEVGASSINIPSKGTEQSVSVASNANWNVTSAPAWCKVEKRGDGIHIIVDKNSRVMERADNIVIESPSKTVIVKVYQGAADEKLSASLNDLQMGAAGGEQIVKVYTDAGAWFIGDFPTWLSVEKIDDSSLRIKCGKNVPNGEPRSGSVQIRTDRQTVGISVTQSPNMVQNLIFPDSRLVGGRNISFGVSASYYMPFVSTSAGGDYVGSVADYGLGSGENASYKSATGFSFGVFADMRLYKNIFLTAGVNYTQVKYKNTFAQNTNLKTPLTDFEYLGGDVMNNYTEEYTHQAIEVPVLVSYRLKTSDVSHVQFNVGPVLNFGLSAKMKMAGATGSDTMHKYAVNGGSMVDQSNYSYHTAVNSEFNLYQKCVLWNESYTTGNDADAAHHTEFKDAPFNRFNCGLRVGVAYEWAGISLGLSYTQMLTNMANEGYWENDRWTVLNNSTETMKGYKHRINSLEVKMAYTLRYMKKKK